jgi:hypothetical protein
MEQMDIMELLSNLLLVRSILHDHQYQPSI